MDSLIKKLEELNVLIKAVKTINSQPKTVGPTLPKLPTPKQPTPPPMTASSSAAPKIGIGQGPNSKKDPKKVAQQIKDGSMSTKTQNTMLKFDSNGQWSLDKGSKKESQIFDSISTGPVLTPAKVNPKDPVLGNKPSEKAPSQNYIQRVKAHLKDKNVLKADSVTGQWYLEPTDPSSV